MTEDEKHSDAIAGQMYNIMHHMCFDTVEFVLKKRNPEAFKEYMKLSRGQKYHFCMAFVERER